MDNFVLPIQLRWSDFDANRHLRHSVYYDFGAMCRTELLGKIGLTVAEMAAAGIGLIIFREEAVFRREIIFSDHITISAALSKATHDYARWSVVHKITKEDGALAATLNLDGAWIDMNKRKLAVPDESIQAIFSKIPRAEEFTFTELARKTP